MCRWVVDAVFDGSNRGSLSILMWSQKRCLAQQNVGHTNHQTSCSHDSWCTRTETVCAISTCFLVSLARLWSCNTNSWNILLRHGRGPIYRTDRLARYTNNGQTTFSIWRTNQSLETKSPHQRTSLIRTTNQGINVNRGNSMSIVAFRWPEDARTLCRYWSQRP